MGIHYGKADFINYGKPSLFLDFANKKSLTDRISGNNLITFTRTSSATYVGSDGLIKTAAVDEPRFDHNPVTGESLGLLIEEGRTNLKTYSSNFNEVNDNNNSGLDVTNGQYGQPFDGNAIFFDHKTIVAGYWRPNNSVTLTAGVTYTTSIFFKAINPALPEVSLVHICYNPFAVAADVYISTMYSNGTYQDYPNGWRRYWHTFTPSQTLTYQIGPSINQNDNLKGSGYIGGMQVETGTFPTSYIPTAGSTATRTADNASITGTNFSSWYSQNAGTFCSITTMNVTENLGLYINSARTIYELAPNVSFTGIENSTLTSRGWTMRSNYGSPSYEIFDNYSKTGTHKMASYFSSSGVGFSVDGRSIVSASVSNPTSLNSSTIYIGNAPDGFGTYGYLNGTISRLTYYPTRLTDTQLQNLTR